MKWVRMFVYEGEFYHPANVDTDRLGIPTVAGYEVYEVATVITLFPDDISQGYGQILQVLLNTGQARKA